jgi:hypothetical protein
VICIEKMILNIRGQAEARAQVEGPQVNYICIKGLIIPPQVIYVSLNTWGEAYTTYMHYVLGREKRNKMRKKIKILKHNI